MRELAVNYNGFQEQSQRNPDIVHLAAAERSMKVQFLEAMMVAQNQTCEVNES
jgi:hypothetical protein